MENKSNDKDELLLKDLCARIPHKAYVGKVKTEAYDLFGVNIKETRLVDYKPWLRPMSDMDESEKAEYEGLLLGIAEGLGNGDVVAHCDRLVEWLDSKHFDHRGLIEKGLAFEAFDGLYTLKRVKGVEV